MNRIYALLFVGIGGLLGSVCRYLVATLSVKLFPLTAFPYGTFIVNVLGCFLIGIFYGLSKQQEWFTPTLSLLLATGFCGGFTTFSSFAYENINLLQTNNYWLFAVYSIISFSLGLIAVFGGLTLVREIIR